MIAIVEYGSGNLASVAKACQKLGYEVLVTDRFSDLERADKIILPGVGAFPQAMQQLQHTGLDVCLRELIQAGKPLLGICLGMQLLFEVGYEVDYAVGLGIIPGEIRRLPATPGFKIPHMGWNRLQINPRSRLLAGLAPGAYMYFVHSYEAWPQQAEHVAAVTDYGHDVTAAVEAGNVFGTQFHPEKSGELGLQILKNFGEIRV